MVRKRRRIRPVVLSIPHRGTAMVHKVFTESSSCKANLNGRSRMTFVFFSHSWIYQALKTWTSTLLFPFMKSELMNEVKHNIFHPLWQTTASLEDRDSYPPFPSLILIAASAAGLYQSVCDKYRLTRLFHSLVYDRSLLLRLNPATSPNPHLWHHA